MTSSQKTILLPVFHGHISRNLLLTGIFKIWSARDDIRWVIVTHDFKKDYLTSKFPGPNVVIEGLDLEMVKIPPVERFFKSLFFFFVKCRTIKMLQREQLDLESGVIRYLFRRLLTVIFGSSQTLRDLIRWFYYHLVPVKTVVTELFKKYRPDAVILPDMTFPVDNYILHQAKMLGLPSIAMLRSWDVLTTNKGIIRLKPDRLVVHNPWLKAAAIKWGDIKGDRIDIGGMPHFDIYFKGQPAKRRLFFEKLGLDPEKRVILYSLNGGWGEGISKDIAQIISRAVSDGRLPPDLQLLIRMHPNAPREHFEKDPHYVFYWPEGVRFNKGRLSDMEFTESWLQELYDVIYYSDVTINAQSTMSIDAAALDKPVINICFDGYQKLPYIKSIRRLYDMDHYRPIVESGGVRQVWSESELIGWLNKYLADPSLDRAGRERIVSEQCFISDGRSAQTTAQYVLDFLDNT